MISLKKSPATFMSDRVGKSFFIVPSVPSDIISLLKIECGPSRDVEYRCSLKSVTTRC